jgi:hypothetical protein
MKKNQIGKVLLAVAFASLLVSCNEDIVNYPSDASNSIVTVTNDGEGEVTDNEMSDIYKTISSSSSVSSTCLDNILYNLATKDVGTHKAYFNDSNGFQAIIDKNFETKWHKEMLDTVKAGTYSTDNYFSEYRYALSLINSGYAIKTAAGSTALADIASAATKDFLITPDKEWADVFKLDYSDYVDRYYKPNIYRKYLTAYHLYTQNYSAIGNTQARTVTVIKLTDRSDKPGQAKKLIDAFVKNYINNTAASAEDTDLHHLERLWKGITTDGSLSTVDTTFLTDSGVDTLYDKITEEVAKIKNNEFTTDTTLESTYTGSYTYPVAHGEELAVRSLSVNDFITEGTYLKSAGISVLPTDLKDRVFSTNFSTDTDGVMKKTVKDNSYIVKHDDGTMYRYVTPLISDSTDDIVTYDSGSSSYFIVQINSDKIVTTSRLASTDGTDEQKAAKKELAIDTAYEMAGTESYKKTAITWFLENNNIDFSDPDFYSYIKTNYPAVIEYYNNL